jgi:hypothetical protein
MRMTTRGSARVSPTPDESGTGECLASSRSKAPHMIVRTIVVEEEQASGSSAEITLLGSGAQGRDDAMQQR